MDGLRKLYRIIKETVWRYRLSGSVVRIKEGAKLTVGRKVKIINSTIVIEGDSNVELGDSVCIHNMFIWVENGSLNISSYSSVEGLNKGKSSHLIINRGNITVGDHSLVNCKRIWCRFGGKIVIGRYTNLNDNSEVRADEMVIIGDYCQISYNVKIWDTNTHNIYPAEIRKELMERCFPGHGEEYERPATRPVVIDNFCWLGENSAVMKGCRLERNCRVGFGTILIGKTIPADSTVVNEIKCKILQ